MAEIDRTPEYRDTTTANRIKALMGVGMKSAQVRDVSGRIETTYEAPLNAAIGDPCLKTDFKYFDGAGGTSRSVIAYQENVVSWPGFEVVSVGAGNDFDLIP